MKTLMLVGNPDATPAMLQCARHVIGCVGWVLDSATAASPYQILIGDGYGIDQAALNEAKQQGIPYRVVGCNRYARNGERRHYERFLPPVTATTIRQKLEARERYMVALADAVVCITDTLLPGGAPDRLYNYAKSFSSKLVFWKTVGERPVEQIGDIVTLYNGITGTVVMPRDARGYLIIQTNEHPQWGCHYQQLRHDAALRPYALKHAVNAKEGVNVCNA
jgi:hypothetical protein